MIASATASSRRPFAAALAPVGAAAAALAFAVVGYVAVVDMRVAVTLGAILAFAGWAVISYVYPRMALSTSFLVVLVAGTKFRMRDADASLEGALDLQVLFEIALFALVAVGAAAAWFAEESHRRLTRAEGAILAYAAVAFASTVWSVAPALTAVRAMQLLVLSALAILAVRVLTPAAALWTACATVAVYVLMCAGLAVAFPWAASPYDYQDVFRFSWFSIHPVEAGTLAAIGALGALSASLLPRPGGIRRVLGIPPFFYTVALTAILILTNSRGPVFAFAGGAAVFLLMSVRPSFRAALVLAAAAAVLLYAVSPPDLSRRLDAFANHDSAVTRLLFRDQAPDTVLALNGRLNLWDDLRPAIAAHPSVGYGYQASRGVVLDAAAWAAYAHNALLQTMLDLGAVGTVALCAVVIIGVVDTGRRATGPWLRATIAAVMAFLLLNSISTESFAGAPGFETLLLFVCVACASAARDERNVRSMS